MIKKILFAALLASTFAACKKAGEDVPVAPVVTVPERIEITPTTSSILVGQTAQFTVKYYNNVGVLAATPAAIVWSTSNMAIATVSTTGLATAVTAGQANITATYNTISSTAAVTVVSNSNVLATVTITPAITQEIL